MAMAGSTNSSSPVNASTCRTARPALVARGPASEKLARQQSGEQPHRLAKKPDRAEPDDRRRGGHEHEIGGQRQSHDSAQR